MKPPILIAGCRRSGASIIASVINLCGGFGGKAVNHKMFINETIQDNILNPYCKNIGMDENGQYPLPESNHLILLQDLKQKVEVIIKQQGYLSGEWFLKDHRLCLTWKIWKQAFPSAKWIIVRRRTGDIIDSCLKTGFMDFFKEEGNQKLVGATDEEGAWLQWVHYHEKLFLEMINSGINYKIVWPERILNKDYEQIRSLISWVGLDWNGEALNEIDRKLWKLKK